mgnify:FL=1
MLYELKQKYVDWQIKKDMPKKREKRFVNWQEVKSVVVLLSYDTPDNSELDRIIAKIGAKDMNVWCYLKTTDYIRKDTELVTFINDKSVSWFNKPNQIICGKFKSTMPDVLIDLTLDENLPMKYLAGISNVKCRCGMMKDK